ncbi:MAG: hypothetical protein Q9227_007316 [Pyrenula ochraceoflavens]
MNDYVHSSLGKLPPKEAPFINNRVMTAELAVPGLLETIQWTDHPDMQRALDPVYIKLELRSASINFKDVLIASGQLEGITKMQNDCSGVVVEVGENMKDRFSPSDRVCAMYSRSYTNFPIVHGDCCHEIPDSVDFNKGASISIVWMTVYYSLMDNGKLQKGESILIHSAAGAVGQDAIPLAQHIGADIFATCGSDSKRDLLKQEFGIPEDHIFSSLAVAFYDKIKGLTGGRGVNVVLNSLSADIFRESCNLVAPFGRFVEIGRKDLMEDALMPMEFLLKNITFAYVDMALMIQVNKALAQRILHDVINLFDSGAVG